MLPPRFEYHRATSVEEAVELLGTYGEDAKILAGGQSLIPLLKFRLASPGHLVDLNPVGDLDRVAEEGGALRLGALVRHARLERDASLRARFPAIAAAAPLISDPLVRNLGTVGGSLAHADPSGDWGAAMLAVGATVVARSRRGEREIPIDGFFRDTFTSALEPDEVLTEVRVPSPGGAVGGAYLKLERKVGDFATVAVAVHVEMDDGRIGRAGIGLTAVGPTNLRAAEAERALAGAEPSEEAFAEAGRLASQAASPISDVRGSAEYKRHVVEVYVRRGLARAVEMARAA